jgi:phosphomannomutase
MLRIEERFAQAGEVDRLDGLTISAIDWWLNVRASNTEPLLRLNVEANNSEIMARIRDEALEVIRQ